MTLNAGLLSVYIDIIALILERLRVRSSGAGIEVRFVPLVGHSIDERIRKIDVARANFVDGLAAIDELRKSAEENKKEVQEAMQQLTILARDKEQLQKKVQSVRQVISSDVETFREIAGVPSPADIRRERVVGFISGVIASVVASGCVYALVKIFKNRDNIVSWFS